MPCLLALPGCTGADEEKPAEVPVPRVMVATVEAHDLSERISATGQLLAKAEASIAAQVEGQIASIAVEEGDAAELGAVLLEIDPERKLLELRDAEAQRVQAEAQLREDRRERNRISTLRERGAVSQAQLDEKQTRLRLSTARLEAAEARVGLAERALADSRVGAPFAGLVARRYVSAGEYVKAGDPLFDLVALDPIEVEFHLAEIDSGRVSRGDPVTVRVAPYPDESFQAKVSAIAPTIDPATRTLRVKGEIPNGEGRLRPGLFARADLGLNVRRGVPMVGEEAILQRSSGPMLFRLLRGGRVESRSVKTGTHRDGLVEILEGIEIGDVIVTRGHSELIDGSLVFVRNADGSLNATFPDPVGGSDDTAS